MMRDYAPVIESIAVGATSVIAARLRISAWRVGRSRLLSGEAKAARICCMRKLFGFCLLVLMSLQLSWAAVGQYCEHEIGQPAGHFGHHAHQHTKSADDARSDKTQPSKGPHADCGLCYAEISLMGAGELAVSFLDVATVHSTTLSTPPTESPLSRPERPKWVNRT